MQTRDSIGLFGGWSGIHIGDDAILLESLRAIEEEAPHRKVQLFCSTPEITGRLIKNTDKVQISPAFRCFTQQETHQLLSSKSSLEKIY
jgi:colanic acid/amylovoran biosynthesis protein